MLIKQFALKYNLSNDTIRFYEKEGLLNPIRLDNGYRFYDEQCEKTIKFIIVLKQLGFSIQEIQLLLTLDQRPLTNECNDSSASLFAQKITAVEKQIEFYVVALQSLKLAEGLIREGKYEANKSKIEAAIEEMYIKITGGMQ